MLVPDAVRSCWPAAMVAAIKFAPHDVTDARVMPVAVQHPHTLHWSVRDAPILAESPAAIGDVDADAVDADDDDGHRTMDSVWCYSSILHRWW